jgi:hypothetical protein
MKYKTIIFFLCLIGSAPAMIVHAFGSSLGSVSNPIYIQVQQDPAQLWSDASSKVSSIQYIPACAQLYSTVKADAAKSETNINVGDPYAIKAVANYLNYLYSSYEMCVSHAAQTVQTQNQVTCAAGTVLSGNECVPATATQSTTVQDMLTGVCQKVSGANSLYTGVTDKSKGGNNGGCSCQSGYGWNSSMSACVVESKETNDQLCFNKFGQGANWDGTKNSAGGLNCGCKGGYVSSGNGQVCVVVPVVPVKTNDQICQDSYGSNSNWAGTKNGEGKINCGCQTGYVYQGGSCIIAPVVPVKTTDQSYTPITPVVPASSDTTVYFTYHANLAEPITEKDMTVISSANLRSCPNETCQSMGKYPKDTIFAVTQRYNDVFGWYGGTTPDGKEGWIYPGMLVDRVDNSENDIASSSAATSSQSELSTSTYVNNIASTSPEVLPQKGFWTRVKAWFGF